MVCFSVASYLLPDIGSVVIFHTGLGQMGDPEAVTPPKRVRAIGRESSSHFNLKQYKCRSTLLPKFQCKQLRMPCEVRTLTIFRKKVEFLTSLYGRMQQSSKYTSVYISLSHSALIFGVPKFCFSPGDVSLFGCLSSTTTQGTS